MPFSSQKDVPSVRPRVLGNSRLRIPAETSVEQSRLGLSRWRLTRVAAYIDERLSESIQLQDMARAAGLSRMHFAAQFRVSTGLRPHEYLLRRRVDLAQRLMTETGNSLADIALSCGFQSQAHFTTVFGRLLGITPHRWRCAFADQGAVARGTPDQSHFPRHTL